MEWIWSIPKLRSEFGADFDYDASRPASNLNIFSDKPVDPMLRPVYRSRSGVKRFKGLHCPPFSHQPVVDAVWRDIILRFVPAERVQFLPVRLIARGETNDDYMWVIPFDRRICIDATRSNVRRKIEKDGLTMIFAVSDIVHHPDCLAGSHLARDPQLPSYIVVSDALKNALCEVGDEGVFRNPRTFVW